MPLNSIVCIKQVPHPEHFSKISLDPITGSIRRAGIPSVLNPLDKNALEEALLHTGAEKSLKLKPSL